MNDLLYNLPRQAGFLPEAALAVARRLNERIPYLPDRVLDEPLDERRIRSIARELDVTPMMSGDATAALFELLARLSHPDCLHSLELLVKRWDVNEEASIELVADAMQPAFSAWWSRAAISDPNRVLDLARTRFHRWTIEALSVALVERARAELRAHAGEVEATRASLTASLSRVARQGAARAFAGTSLLESFSPDVVCALVKVVAAVPTTSVEAIFAADDVVAKACESWRVLDEPFVRRRASELVSLIACPELRQIVAARPEKKR